MKPTLNLIADRIVLLWILLSPLSGCNLPQTPSVESASSASKIRIGEVTPLTGNDATFGRSTHRGLELAIQEINQEGGINGHLLELITLDDQGKTEEAVLAVEKLISQEKVLAIVGEVSSTRSIAMASIAQSHHIPMIAPSSINTKLTRQGDYIFRVCYIDRFQSQVMSDVALNVLRAKRVALLVDIKSDYSLDSAELFSEFFEKGGGKIVLKQNYSANDIDFKAQLTSIRTVQPDLILAPGYYTEIGLIVRQARELGIQVPFLGGDGWDSPLLREIANTALDGTYFVSHFSQDYSSGKGPQFLEHYHALYGNSPPDGLTALGYDTGLLITDALRRAQSITPLHLRSALASTRNFPGLTGMITINAERNARKSAVVFQFIKGGQLKLAMTVQPTND